MSGSTSCTTCGRPPENVCPGCLAGTPPPERLADLEAERAAAEKARRAQLKENLKQTLVDLAEAFPLLPLFRLAGSRPVDPEKRVGTSSPARPPLVLAVLDLEDSREKADSDPQRLDYDLDRRAGARRNGVVPTLQSWVRRADGEMHDQDLKHNPPGQALACGGACMITSSIAGDLMQGPCTYDRDKHLEPATIGSETAWLQAHVDWISKQPWADEIAAELEQMLTDIKAVTGWSRAEPDRCPDCNWIVEPRDGGAWYVCTGCARTWAMQSEINRLFAEQSYSMLLSECAAEVERPVSTLKEWRARGWVNPVGKDHRGYLYDVRKVRAVAEEVRQGKKRSA